jgi:uncharacterized membrane protein
MLDVRACKVILADADAPDPNQHTTISAFFSALSGLSKLVISASLVSNLIQVCADTGFPQFWDKLANLSVNGNVAHAFPLPPHILSLQLRPPTLAHPERLPRSILSLSVASTRLLGHTLLDLPPRLCRLTLSRESLEMPGNDVIPFPPSLLSSLMAPESLQGKKNSFIAFLIPLALMKARQSMLDFQRALNSDIELPVWAQHLGLRCKKQSRVMTLSWQII